MKYIMGGSKSKPNEYKFIDDQTIEITLNQGMTCIIDASDYDLVKNYKWYYDKSKKVVFSFYNGKQLRMHRLIMNDKGYITHINDNCFDNRRSNLCKISRLW
jgi:hypothetical protein